MQSNVSKIDEGIIKDAENIIPDTYKTSIENGIINQEKTLAEYTKTISKNDVKMEMGEVIKNIDIKIKNCSIALNKLIRFYKRLKVAELSADISPTDFVFFNPDPESLLKLPNEIEKYQRVANLAKYIIDNNFIFTKETQEPSNFIPPNFDDTADMFLNYKSFVYWQIFTYLSKQFSMPMINLEMFSNAEIVYKYEITNLFDPIIRQPITPPAIGAVATSAATTATTATPIAPPTTTISGGDNANNNKINRNKTNKNVNNKGERIKRFMTKEEYVKMLKLIQFPHRGKFENLFKYTNDNIKDYIKLTFSEFINPYDSQTRDDKKKPLRYSKNDNKLQRRLIYKLKDDKTRENLFVVDELITKIERKPIRILDFVFDVFNKEIEYKYDDLMKLVELFQRERIYNHVKEGFNNIKRSMSSLLKADKDFKNGKSTSECALIDYDTKRPLTSSLADYSLTELRDIAEKITADDKEIHYDGIHIDDSTFDVELLKSVFKIANAVIGGYFTNPNKKLRALFDVKIAEKEKEKIFIGAEQVFDKFKPKPELIQYELINMYLKKYDITFINFLHIFRYKDGKEMFDKIRERIYKFLIGYYSIYSDKLIDYILRLGAKYEIPIPTLKGLKPMPYLRDKSRMKISEMLAALPERYTVQIREMEANVLSKHPRDSEERRQLVRKLEELIMKTYDNYLEEMKPVAEYRPNSSEEVRDISNVNRSKNKNLNKKLRNVFEN